MTLLAIGATVFIGPHLVRHLVQQGHEVVVFHRGETDADLPDAVQPLHGDRNALSDHRDAFESVAPDVVIDVVPYTEAQAREAPLRDTHYPYRGYEGLDFAYAEDYDKILVERAVLNSEDLAGTVLRLPAVYGPGNAQHRLAPHFRRMDDARPAILMDEGQAGWRWTHGYVENVAAAIACAATDERAAGQIYNVGEAEAPTEAERVRRLAAVVGWNGDVVPVPSDDLPEQLRAPGDWQYELETDTRRLRDEIGYEAPVTGEEALHRTVEWERAQRVEADTPAPDYEAEDAVLENWL